MSKTRESKKLITEEISQQEAEQFFADYAEADAKVQRITAEMDIKITEIRKKYQEKLTDLEEVKAMCFEKLQHFATQKPGLFAKKKSLELTHGIIGFRTATPSLKALKGFTWPSVCNLLKEMLPEYVRVKEEADKEKLLADREKLADVLPKVGIKVEQSESFYVEPKKEEVTA